jgi:hypothetical protein
MITRRRESERGDWCRRGIRDFSQKWGVTGISTQEFKYVPGF